jgi:hypothetical protein
VFDSVAMGNVVFGIAGLPDRDLLGAAFTETNNTG